MNRDFGAYEIVNKIGVGGMATVYTAVQKSLGRTVVLKTMHEHLREDPTFVARFEREAKAAAAMSHDNIVQIIDYGLVDETWYIAMEYVSGWDLKKWLEQNDPLPVEIGTLLLYDVCAGLAHAHAHHIVHRDIKPANIMLAPTGVPKIADFGLAKQTQESTVLTVHDTMIGTVPYMSPEHATGQHIDERSDIFSLGVVAYEIFGGRRPFAGGSSASVINAIITLEPLPLANLNPLVTDDLHRVVSKMLEKDPAKRYESADAVRRDLETVIDQWGVTRGRDLLAACLANPRAVRASLTERRFREHLNRARQFRGMGLGKIEDAIREFERAHYLAPDNEEVGRELEKLRAEMPASGSSAAKPNRRAWTRVRPMKGRMGVAVGAAAAVLALTGTLLALRGGDEATRSPTDRAVSERRDARVAAVSGALPARTTTTTPADPDEENASKPAAMKPLPLSEGASPPVSSGAAAPVSSPGSSPVPSPSSPPAPPPGPTPAKSIAPRSGTEAPAPVPASGSLEITARPSATFLVNGRVFAEDVTAVSLLFAPGAYDVRLDNPYYGSKTWSGVEVVSNETKTLIHDFTKDAKGAFLTITTNRIPAMIWIDGAPTDKWTPQRSFPIPPGLHRVTVKKEGFRTEEGVIETGVRDGATAELSFTLEEIAGS